MGNLDVNSKENNKFKALELCLFIVLVDIKSDVGSLPSCCRFNPGVRQ